MDFFKLRTLGDPVLRAHAQTVATSDEISYLLPTMEKVMDAADGVGLAAPQIGILKRLCVMRLPTEGETPPDQDPLSVLINPQLVWVDEDEDIQLESCLSIPTVSIPVARPKRCRIQAETMDGSVTLDLVGRAARIAQHELDHLEGILILDRAMS